MVVLKAISPFDQAPVERDKVRVTSEVRRAEALTVVVNQGDLFRLPFVISPFAGSPAFRSVGRYGRFTEGGSTRLLVGRPAGILPRKTKQAPGLLGTPGVLLARHAPARMMTRLTLRARST